MPLQEIEAILSKYSESETKINSLLDTNALDKEAKRGEERIRTRQQEIVSLTEAMKRNKQTLKDLETVKGALRSKAIYSPIEMQWEDICRRYQEEPSLPVTTWRCHLPVFV